MESRKIIVVGAVVGMKNVVNKISENLFMEVLDGAWLVKTVPECETIGYNRVHET